MIVSSYVYDIEVYPNLFLVVFINLHHKYNTIINDYIDADIKNDTVGKINALHKLDYKVFVISPNLNEIGALVEFVKEKSIVGYNNHSYDDKIIRLLLFYYSQLVNKTNQEVNTAIFNLSDTIINGSAYYSENPLLETVSKFGGFYSVDLMRTHYLDKKRVSLKQVAIKINWYRIQDLPITPGQLIKEEEIYDIKDYCINDVLITRALWYAKIGDIKLRQKIKNTYEMDVLSSSRSSIADKILYKMYCSKSGEYLDKNNYTSRVHINFGNIIDSNICFRSPHMTDFLRQLKLKVFNIYEDKFDPFVTIGETSYQLGVGGLHSIDRPGILKSNDKYTYRDADVQSYYPRIIINLKVCPKHLDPYLFIYIVEKIVSTRLLAKTNSGDKTLTDKEREDWGLEAFVLKIVVNAIFGKLGSEGWLQDHAALYKTTLNGQLYLLELIDELEYYNIPVVSANTDGIVAKVPKELEQKYYEICKNWESKFSFVLEYTDYSKYIRRNVNSYLAITKSGKVKVKNDFVYNLDDDPDHLIKGFDARIIPYALYKYYVDGIPFEKTVKECNDIYWFCKSQKVGDKFNTKFYEVINGLIVIRELQKSNRYFVSNTGGSILKEEGKKKINIIKGYNITLFNDFYYSDNYNINYGYYTKECRKIVDEINGTSLKILKKSTGTLFDDID